VTIPAFQIYLLPGLRALEKRQTWTSDPHVRGLAAHFKLTDQDTTDVLLGCVPDTESGGAYGDKFGGFLSNFELEITMTDDHIEQTFAYGCSPRTDEQWVQFRGYVERWEAERELTYKSLLSRIREQNPGLLVQLPISPPRLTPRNLEWLEKQSEAANAEVREVRKSADEALSKLKLESEGIRAQYDVVQQEALLLRHFLETQVVGANVLLRRAQESKRSSEFWLAGSSICALGLPLFAALAWLEDRSVPDAMLISASVLGFGFASAWYFRRQALGHFRRLKSLAKAFTDAGFVVYKKRVFLGSELAVGLRNAAVEGAIIEVDKWTIERIEPTVD
jgi:hypothetical protein